MSGHHVRGLSTALLLFSSYLLYHRGFRRVFFQAMPRNAICFQCSKFKRAEPDLLREMKLAPTTNSRAASSPAAGDGAAEAAGVASTRAMSPSQRLSVSDAAPANQREYPFGNGILGVGGISRNQLLGGSLSQQAEALSLRAPTNMVGGATHQSPSEGMAFANNSMLQARAANLLALESNQMGLLPQDGLGNLLCDQTGSAARFSMGGAFPGRPINSLVSTDSARQNALQVMLERERLMWQLQDQQRQPQHSHSAAIPGQDMGDHLLSTLMSSNALDADTATSNLLYGQLQQARQEQQLQQVQQEQELQRHLQLRQQQQLLNNQLFAGAVGRQNLGETKQDHDPQDGADDLLAYLRLNQR